MTTQIYIHQPLFQEVHAIGGYYTLLKESQITLHGRQVLYLVCQAHLDNSCCGVGGGRYIQVPGFIVKWKGSQNQNGMGISEVEPIREPHLQAEVRNRIRKGEHIEQIYFM